MAALVMDVHLTCHFYYKTFDLAFIAAGCNVLFYWCGDLGYKATLSKYGVPKNAKVTNKFLIDKVRFYVDGLI